MDQLIARVAARHLIAYPADSRDVIELERKVKDIEKKVDQLMRRRSAATTVVDRHLEARAPQLPKGKWILDKKTYNSADAAIKAAVAKSMSADGKAIKVWEQGDPIKGIRGNRGYSVSVKSLSRKAQNL